MYWATAGLLAVYLLTLLLIPVVLLKTQRHPASTAAWLLTILFVPYVGALLFFLAGRKRIERHAEWKRQAAEQAREEHLTADSEKTVLATCGLPGTLAAFAEETGAERPTADNRIEALPEPSRAFELLERDIRAARHTLHVQYYIWRKDRIGTRLRDLLIEKAGEGVTIRFMYDGIGSLWLSRSFLQPMKEAGIAVTPFLPGRSFMERWSINLRNHRKMVNVDGRISFTGGLNVGDEYLGRDPGWGYWRDTQLQIRGPLVQHLNRQFAEDWYFATGERLADELEGLPDQQGTDPPAPSEDGRVTAQLIADGPDRRERLLQQLLLTAITQAREQVTISTGYFIPPESLHEALQAAARRGVRVRLLLAGASTYFYTLWAGRSWYQPLLEAGVEIYEYQKGLFHAKTMTVDGCWSLVGSPNFDLRSLNLNFELAVAVFDEKFASELLDHFTDDVSHADRIDPARWRERSDWVIRGENFCRLFAPLL